jgi:hypothetical protein
MKLQVIILTLVKLLQIQAKGTPRTKQACEVLRGTNRFRGPSRIQLKGSRKLDLAAARYCNVMMRFNKGLDHEVDGTTPGLRASRAGFTWKNVAENIYWEKNHGTFFSGTRRAIVGWINSPGHAKNMLNNVYTHHGAAGCIDTDGSFFFAQEFGTPKTAKDLREIEEYDCVSSTTPRSPRKASGDRDAPNEPEEPKESEEDRDAPKELEEPEEDLEIVPAPTESETEAESEAESETVPEEGDEEIVVAPPVEEEIVGPIAVDEEIVINENATSQEVLDTLSEFSSESADETVLTSLKNSSRPVSALGFKSSFTSGGIKISSYVSIYIFFLS